MQIRSIRPQQSCKKNYWTWYFPKSIVIAPHPAWCVNHKSQPEHINHRKFIKQCSGLFWPVTIYQLRSLVKATGHTLQQFTLSARAIACANARVKPYWKIQDPAKTESRSVRFSNVTVYMWNFMLQFFNCT